MPRLRPLRRLSLHARGVMFPPLGEELGLIRIRPSVLARGVLSRLRPRTRLDRARAPRLVRCRAQYRRRAGTSVPGGRGTAENRAGVGGGGRSRLVQGAASSALCAPRSCSALGMGSGGTWAVRRHPSRRSATQVNGSDVFGVTPGATDADRMAVGAAGEPHPNRVTAGRPWRSPASSGRQPAAPFAAPSAPPRPRPRPTAPALAAAPDAMTRHPASEGMPYARTALTRAADKAAESAMSLPAFVHASPSGASPTGRVAPGRGSCRRVLP